MRFPIRARTLPGPTSTKEGAPASCMAMTVSRQRTGEIRAFGKLFAHVRERRGARAGIDGEARLVDLDLVERGPERRDRGLHQRRVERAGDVEADHAGTALVCDLLGLVERVDLAREDDLAGRVVVGDGDAAFGGDLARVLERRADEREHRAVARLAHQAAAQDDELERVFALEHARGGQRGQLAERVAGAGARVQVERVPADDGRAEDGGLCEAGVLLHAGEGILADELSDLLEQLGCALGDQVAHFGGMAPLTREERRGFGCVAHTCTITHASSAVTPSLLRYPLGGGWTPPLRDRGPDAGLFGPPRRGCAR